jgi:pimeloyl-ACP methyl ester carboxylesterase
MLLLPGAAPAPIEEAGLVPIGGIDQWVAVRGRDRSRPAILFLHGGPGEAQSPSLAMFAPWEARYVTAQWDQRGSGKTFEKYGTSTPDMTLDRIARDAVEVAEEATRRLGVRKLILVGHSWGSMVGLKAIRLRPEVFHAFIGTGQVVNGSQILERMRLSAVARAQAAKDTQAVVALSALGPEDMGDMTKLPLVFKWQAPFTGTDTDYLQVEYGRSGPEADKWREGGRFSLSRLMPFLPGYDLPVPYFVIQGRDDPRTPPDAARAFVQKIRAPATGYEEIDGGHFACITNPTGFLDKLDQAVRRLGIA